MQNKNQAPIGRRPNAQIRSVLPCELYDPRRKSAEAEPKTNKKLCIAVITVLLLFAAVILIVSIIKGPDETAYNDLPTFFNLGSGAKAVRNTDKTDITVCIDPGHGFDDPGALCDFSYKNEKDLNLEIALLLANDLTKMGYDIIMTRDSDTPPDWLEPNENGLYLMNPNKRTDFVLENDADVFISIHCNAVENAPSIIGTKLYYYGPSNPLTLKYAKVLRDAISSDLPERATETIGTSLEDSLAVNRDISIPSVLVECGYLTSPEDSALLCDPEWQRVFAQALANGIDKFAKSKK